MLGDTENAVVVTDLLADLVARGLRYEHGILAVLDGPKALRTAVLRAAQPAGGSKAGDGEHLVESFAQ